MDHAEKVRQKVEVNQMVDILQNHKNNNFWEANLRKTIKGNNTKDKPMRTS